MSSWRHALAFTVFFAAVLVGTLWWYDGRLVSWDEHYQTLPMYVGMSCFLLAFYWTPVLVSKFAGAGRESSGIRALASVAAAVVGVALTSALHSLLRADDPHQWLSANLASGRLSFYLSAVVFGALTFPKLFRDDAGWYARDREPGGERERRELNAWAVGAQNMIYGASLVLLGVCYTLMPDAALLGLLSWAVFFVIDEWAVLEHFVIFGGAPLPRWHFLTVSAFNAVIIVCCVAVTDQLMQRLIALREHGPGATATFLWLGRISFGLAALVLIPTSIWLLYRHVGKAHGSEEKAEGR